MKAISFNLIHFKALTHGIYYIIFNSFDYDSILGLNLYMTLFYKIFNFNFISNIYYIYI